VVLEDEVTVGEDCRIGPYVVCYRGVEIGSRVIIKAGSVCGGIGFGYATGPEGHTRIPHIGRCVLEDDVEIGSHTCIDRGSVDDTVIGRGTKIDNLVQVAHGVRVGQRVLLAAQVGLAGSTVVEDDVVLAGQVGVAGHLTIGRGAVATAQSGIPNDVEAKALVSGYPAIDNREWLKASAVVRRLPDLKRTVADLEARLAALEARLANRGEGSDR
jgi:UDP-3-O-[3-hydroxymyristoyl] glucosamine N-acyltransferase